MTTADRSSLLAHQPNSLHFQKGNQKNPVIDVDDKQTYQSMDGFGFALTGGSAQLMMRMDAPSRSALLKELFGRGKGEIGVSYLRVSIGSSDMNDHVFTYDDLPESKTDPNLSKFNLGPDRDDVIPVLKEILAINPGMKILGSPWTAPSWMKSNDNPKDGNLKPEYYATYAHYFVKYISAMKAEGITIDAITVQNEPLNGKNTPSMVMQATDQDRFIREDLGPAFRKAGLKTKIILYDHNCDVPEYPLTILNDAHAAQFVDGSGFHLYEGKIDAMTQVHDAHPDKNLYFTEQMVVDNNEDPKLDIASALSRVLVGATRNWSRNVLLWNLAADPQFGPHTNNGGCPVCEGAITLDGNRVTRNIAYYTIAHASKFVPPGSVRIQSNTSESLPNVAFKTPTNKIVLIVANPGNVDRMFDISFHGKSITSTLKSGSVGTFVW
ncbi:glycoside hydrolase family 30 beta sandwich domain-containing protein [Acidicapsa dinghuensis]|uniref:Glycoside hydrolase family 30 beta sandwich domain-containing protein n=1 Tax=Acidicapsa dinghuensis TaxID=2218256 RepID=A0ABW1EG13_9BACT|nr:glycoside hydrolase family 30 beta sandwich domain-containing protein [Acidicapsa dinghuensis]